MIELGIVDDAFVDSRLCLAKVSISSCDLLYILEERPST